MCSHCRWRVRSGAANGYVTGIYGGDGIYSIGGPLSQLSYSRIWSFADFGDSVVPVSGRLHNSDRRAEDLPMGRRLNLLQPSFPTRRQICGTGWMYLTTASRLRVATYSDCSDWPCV